MTILNMHNYLMKEKRTLTEATGDLDRERDLQNFMKEYEFQCPAPKFHERDLFQLRAFMLLQAD